MRRKFFVRVLSLVIAVVLGVPIPSAASGTIDHEPPYWCELPAYGLPSLRATQQALEHVHNRVLQSIDRSRQQARRSARLPEYLRVQAGTRFDSDRENRVRMAQDFDGFGVPSKSSLEDRSTNQHDLYIDVRASAEWRLSRLRWSDAESSLRREETQSNQQLREELEELHAWWLEILKLARFICEDEPASSPASSPARPAARSSARTPSPPESSAEAIYRLVSLSERIDFISDGFLSESWEPFRHERLGELRGQKIDSIDANLSPIGGPYLGDSD